MSNWLRFLTREFFDEWKFMLTSPPILLILLFVPVFYPIVVSFLYQANNPLNRPVAVVDEDNSSLSRTLIFNLNASQDIAVTSQPANIETGWEMIQKSETELLVLIPSGFSSDIKKHGQGHLSVWINTANMLTYGSIAPALNDITMEMNRKLDRRFFYSQQMTASLADQRIMPVSIDTHSLFTPMMGYGNFLVTGIFLIVIQQIVLIGLACTVGLRREEKKQVFIAPYPYTWILAKALAQFFFYLAATFFILLVVFPLFGWSIQSMSSMLILFLVFLCGIIPFGIMFTPFMPDTQTPFQTLMFVSTPLFMISGFTWPLDQMPSYIRVIASLFPTTPGLQAMRIVSMKSGSLAAIWPYLVWILAQGLVYSVIGIIGVRWITFRRNQTGKMKNHSTDSQS